MTAEIRRLNGELIGTGDSVRWVAEEQKADLRWASLCGADLREADLREADLSGADLRGADLRWASLRWANLRGANLRGAKLNWQSHDMLAEILRTASGNDIEKAKVAGFVLISRGWCWKQFLATDDPLMPWAIGVLREYITDGDDHPKELDDATTDGSQPRKGE